LHYAGAVAAVTLQNPSIKAQWLLSGDIIGMIKFCATLFLPGVYPDFCYPCRSGVIPAIIYAVSRDTPSPGAHFEQVTFQRIGPRL
jgi:hypothetical protein